MAKKGLPSRRACATMAVHHHLLELYPEFRRKQTQLEHATMRMMFAGAREVEWKTCTIPVVVHVVYKTPAENITAAQVRSQIRVLNRDFRATNTDRAKVPPVWRGLVANCGVNFALAKRDPMGKATTGITRTKTAKAGFPADDSVKFRSKGGADAWPTDKYLNIWVCSLKDGLLGYAQFPGGPSRTDGVVILNVAFGTTGAASAPFNLGRTATHEVGHWLNLRHIWGDTEDCSGTDFVVDTPNAAGPNFGKPAFPHVSCNNGPNGDMFMNYMDYVDDNAMFMFTSQQVIRIQAALNGPRRTLGVRR